MLWPYKYYTETPAYLHHYKKQRLVIFNLCSETPFSKNLHRVETNQLICIANQLAGFYMIQAFTESFSEQTAVENTYIRSKSIYLSKFFNFSVLPNFNEIL